MTKDGSWTLHDTRRKKNLPKVEPSSNFWNWDQTLNLSLESYCQNDGDKNHSILIYNRIHKSGSTTTVSITNHLSNGG